jgi:hypothetical protein
MCMESTPTDKVHWCVDAQACTQINHADVLEQMAPADRETALLLMCNMAANMRNPALLEQHMRRALVAPSERAPAPRPLCGRLPNSARPGATAPAAARVPLASPDLALAQHLHYGHPVYLRAPDFNN